MEINVEPINHQLGRWAEQRALYVLQQHGFCLVEKNFRSRFGEIDLIVKRGQTLVFVEVKARSSFNYGYAIEMVHPSQQRKIIKTAHYFLARYPKYQEFFCQFDVISFDFMQKFAKNIQYDFSKLRYDQQWIENAFTL